MSRERAWPVLFVLGEVVVLVLIVNQVLRHVLPQGLATQIGHNSESFILAALLTLQLVWLRSIAPRRAARETGWEVAALVVVVAVLLALVAVVLDLNGNPRLKTLNEPVFAAAVLMVYLAVRPRSRSLAVFSLVALVVTVAFFHTDVVRLQAECLVALVLAPVGFDLAAPWILRPGLRHSRLPAVLWTGFLLLAPFALMGLKHVDLPGDFLDAAVLYAARGNEAFWGLFLVHLTALLAWAPAELRSGDRVPA